MIVPVPVKVTDTVPYTALLVMLKVAVAAPTAAGTKVRVTAQDAPAATDAFTQVSVSEKLAALAPEILIAVISSGTLPVLVMGTIWLTGEATACGAKVTGLAICSPGKLPLHLKIC